MRQSLQGDYNLSLSQSDATVLSLLGSAVETASGSVGTEISELSDSAILFRVNWLRLMDIISVKKTAEQDHC